MLGCVHGAGPTALLGVDGLACTRALVQTAIPQVMSWAGSRRDAPIETPHPRLRSVHDRSGSSLIFGGSSYLLPIVGLDPQTGDKR